MTAYFDDVRKEVNAIDRGLDDLAFATELAKIEARIAKDVSLCTGDREFPDDLRERIQRAIAIYQVGRNDGLPPTQGQQESIMFRDSQMCERLHSLFHELASRRLRLRFGLVQDSPRGFLLSRTEWIREGDNEKEDRSSSDG